MKKFALFSSLTFASASLLLLCGAASGPAPIQKAAGSGPVLGSKLATTIDLNDSTEEEIRSYYSSLSDLDSAERRGNNLLKNLKPILQDFTYYKYDDVWKIYEITDREWQLSPAQSDTSNGVTYDSETKTFTKYTYGSSTTDNKGTNPFIHALYRNRDSLGVTNADAQIRAWDDHNSSGLNREHVWCQSRGFKASSGASGPAGTDVHHLIAADGRINQAYHNNNPYGYVDKTVAGYKDAGVSDKFWLDGNLLGAQKTKHDEDVVNSVFEPQDCDKGDIARAVFYMAACYNNWSGNETITQFNPNLVLADYATSAGENEASKADHPVAMGILSDLLEWHKKDPVDSYEIHRNNLIFKNYQHNRNPFIDFPDWVDIIWGSKKDSTTAAADPVNDSISKSGTAKHISIPVSKLQIKVGETLTTEAKITGSQDITWAIEDTSIATVTPKGISCEITGLKEGETKLTATIVYEGVEETVSRRIEVTNKTSSGGESDSTGSIISQIWEANRPIIIPVALGVIVIFVILIIVFMKMSKKDQKKVLKTVKKTVSKFNSTPTSSTTKSKTSKSKTKSTTSKSKTKSK